MQNTFQNILHWVYAPSNALQNKFLHSIRVDSMNTFQNVENRFNNISEKLQHEGLVQLSYIQLHEAFEGQTIKQQASIKPATKALKATFVLV